MSESLRPGDDSSTRSRRRWKAAWPCRKALPGHRSKALSWHGARESTHEAGLQLQVRSQWSYARMRFFRHRLALIGLVGLVVIFGAGVFANFAAPYGYAQIDLAHILQGPSSAHYFGTDALGRDQFTRVVWGIRTSMEVGVFVALVSTVVGLVIGAVAGSSAAGWTTF